jgi:hypothetical protein
MDKAIETGDTLDEETLETVAKLHTLLRPFILRRLKSEVETQLPGKFEHVVYCKLSKRQRFLYDEFMSRASTKEALTSGGYLGVVNTLMQLRKVCNHPDLFEVRPVRTSFAMERSVLADFEPSELLVRKRLLQRKDAINWMEAISYLMRLRWSQRAANLCRPRLMHAAWMAGLPTDSTSSNRTALHGGVPSGMLIGYGVPLPHFTVRRSSTCFLTSPTSSFLEICLCEPSLT